jgi:hypothetical protein
MTIPTTVEQNALNPCPQTPADVQMGKDVVPNAPGQKLQGQGLATASAALGFVGALGYLLLMAIVSGGMASSANALSGNDNPLAVMGSGMAVGIWMAEVGFLGGAVLFLLNIVGLILGGVAICRTNGRALGLLGLFLNGVSMPFFALAVQSLTPR